MPSIETTTISCWNTESVSDFDSGNQDIFVVERRPFTGLETVVSSCRVHEYFAPVQCDTALREVRYGLAEFRIRSNELANDISGLAISFLTQFRIETARLRIEVTRSRSCPNFHSDNVNVRMVTTYIGPTTEYQYVGENTVHTVSLFGLVFLKGRSHPNHQDSVHHRSPDMSKHGKRLCVAIDF